MQPTDIRTRLRDPAPEPLATVTTPVPAAATTQVLPPSAFRSGQAEEALRDALGYGLYARAAEDGREPVRMPGEAATAELVERYRAQANADLHAFAYRYLHNHAEQIRLDAVREHAAKLRSPPGFLKLVLASAFGVALAGLLWQWLAPWVATHGGVGPAAEFLLSRLRSLGA